jgi:hypothetical protein
LEESSGVHGGDIWLEQSSGRPPRQTLIERKI